MLFCEGRFGYIQVIVFLRVLEAECKSTLINYSCLLVVKTLTKSCVVINRKQEEITLKINKEMNALFIYN